jgi:hypothetical protein
LLQEKLQNRVSVIGVIVLIWMLPARDVLLHGRTSRREAGRCRPEGGEGNEDGAVGRTACGLRCLRIRQHMVCHHATPRSGRAYAYPMNSAILVLLCETAGCKMEQKKDTILLDE